MRTAVYKVAHKASGRAYIGVSTNPKRRWRAHIHLARRQSTTHFHRALRKYGPEAFDWTILTWVSSFQSACTIEQLFIVLGLGQFNMTEGGDGALNPTPEVRLRISEAQRARPHLFSREHRENLSKAQIGREIGQFARDAVAASNRRRTGEKRPPLSEAHRQAISLARRAMGKMLDRYGSG